MRQVALLAASAFLVLAFAGCLESKGGSSPTTLTSTGPVAKKDATVTWSGEVTRDRTLKVTLSQDGAELRSGTFTVTPSQKNVKTNLFTQSVVAKDFQVRVLEGSNPAGTEKVQPQTCAGSKVAVDIHAVDDTVHIAWKCS